MFKLLGAVAGLFVFTSVSSAQVIYQPVTYVHGSGENTYYYGGSDPHVHSFAARAACIRELKDRSVSPFTAVKETWGTGTPRVYLDCVPYQNAAVYGATPADARNEAYASAPRHFRKRDLLEAAIPVGNGLRVVPANLQPAKVERDETPRAARPAAEPQPILIIPKRMMDKKLSHEQTASAQ